VIFLCMMVLLLSMLGHENYCNLRFGGMQLNFHANLELGDP